MKAIWIIDDDKSIRWVFEKALARTDLNFKTFSSIKDALHAIKDEEPQVIVSDIRMPQGSGLELLQVIKEKYAHIPVIIMTAYSDLESAVAAFHWLFIFSRNSVIPVRQLELHLVRSFSGSNTYCLHAP